MKSASPAGILTRESAVHCIGCAVLIIGQMFSVHDDQERSVALCYRYPLCRTCAEIEAPATFRLSNGKPPEFPRSLFVEGTMVVAIGTGMAMYLHKKRRVNNSYRAYANGREALLRGYLAWLPDDAECE